MRLEICGGIASGKTTLVNLLKNNGYKNTVYEKFQTNPFWEPFYSNPGKYIFETEITFTLQHYHQIKKITTNDLIITDYSFILDSAYAKLGLSENRLLIFEKIIEEIYLEIGEPTHLIYLECDAQEELKRIHTRNRNVEKNIEQQFLSLLNTEISSLVSSSKEKIKCLIINSQDYNFFDNQGDISYILKTVNHFINN